jgi:hypothetical protein
VSMFSASSPKTMDRNRGSLATLTALAAFALFGATGCAAEVRGGAYYRAPVVTYYEEPVAYEEPVTYVAAAPVVNIEAYPRAYYRGSYTYYVDGRWYYPSARGWAYYRSEPRALVTHRVDIERRHPSRGYSAPREQRVYEAAPARKHREYAEPRGRRERREHHEHRR